MVHVGARRQQGLRKALIMWTIWTDVGETNETWLTEAEVREALRSWPTEAYALDDSGNYIEDPDGDVLEWQTD
jgi:hypothetical protein